MTAARSDAFATALASDGPSADIPAGHDIYAAMLGSWTLQTRDYGEDGSVCEQHGEWHFSRALEGRAIADVFIVPGRDARATPPESRRGNRYGISLRWFDPAIAAWRLHWINPVTAGWVALVARRIGDEIVQTGWRDEHLLMRWRFTEITARSFRWLGDVSSDGGQSWRLEAEFRATRRP